MLWAGEGEEALTVHMRVTGVFPARAAGVGPTARAQRWGAGVLRTNELHGHAGVAAGRLCPERTSLPYPHVQLCSTEVPGGF